MINMSYCRFENTLAAMRECYEEIEAEDLSFEEKQARKKLIALCRAIADSEEGEDE